jgi:hypothetical protein
MTTLKIVREASLKCEKNRLPASWKSLFGQWTGQTNMAKLAFFACGFWLNCHPLVGLQKAYAQISPIQKFALFEEKYIGRYEDLARDGYVTVSSIGRLNFDTMAQSFCKPFKGEFDCIYVLSRIEGRDDKGHPMHSAGDMLHLRLPKTYRYLDTIDTNCRSRLHVKADVLAIGQFSWRKRPLVGGRAHSIKKAWRIDYEKLQFVEIKASEVSCVIRDDRN